MRKKTWFLMLVLSVLSAVPVVSGADRAGSPSRTKSLVERLEKGIAPFKSMDIQLETLDDPVIARKPMVVCHLVFIRTRRYRKEVRTPNKVAGLPDEITYVPDEVREFADFVAVPKESTFQAENALRFTTEDVRSVPPEQAKTAFRKYGILWKNAKTPFKVYTLYLGEDAENHYFGQANLSVLLWFRRAFHLYGGESSLKLLGDALSVQDTEGFTCRFAIAELAKYKNEALPILEESIRSSLELDVPPSPQFLCMKMIDTPEADRMLCKYADSRDEKVLTGLFRAFEDFVGIRPSQKNVFLRMISSRIAPKLGIQAVMKVGLEKEIVPLLRDYVNQPRSFEDYSIGVRTLFMIRNPEKKTPHASAAEQIKLLLMRGGELPDTLNFTDINESEFSREQRLSKQDEERIKPYVDIIAGSPDTDIGILTALELALFSTKMPAFNPRNQTKGVKNTYLDRVRRTGGIILRQLPRDQVLRAFNALLSFVENDREHQLLESAYRVYSAPNR